MLFLQRHPDYNFSRDFDSACAMYAQVEKLEKIKLITFEEVDDLNEIQLKNNIFAGTVEFMQKVFSKIGKEPRVPKFFDREYEEVTAKQALELVDAGERFFVKTKEIKLFTGQVVSKYDCSILRSVPEDAILIKTEVFSSNIITEWRCYIHFGRVVEARNYSGEFDKMPDFSIARNDASKNIDSFPVAYTIDLALLEDGSTKIVEYNDMWAIGNYGIDNKLYLRLLKDRYFEIVRK